MKGAWQSVWKKPRCSSAAATVVGLPPDGGRRPAVFPGGGSSPAAAALAADYYDCEPPEDADELDESTVLEPEDVEVRELLAEITAWERRERLKP